MLWEVNLSMRNFLADASFVDLWLCMLKQRAFVSTRSVIPSSIYGDFTRMLTFMLRQPAKVAKTPSSFACRASGVSLLCLDSSPRFNTSLESPISFAVLLALFFALFPSLSKTHSPTKFLCRFNTVLRVFFNC